MQVELKKETKNAEVKCAEKSKEGKDKIKQEYNEKCKPIGIDSDKLLEALVGQKLAEKYKKVIARKKEGSDDELAELDLDDAIKL